MKLVIVETPAQAKTLSTILGESWRVEPCHGHVRDFRAGKLGVDVENGFAPEFSIAPGRGGLVVRLKKLLRQADVIYAATPPGRGGELMAWHVLALVADSSDKPVFRVELAALTPDIVRDAFRLPRPLDLRLIDAELTRRIVGRLISAGVSAAVSTSDTPPLSYASMLALRLVQGRERQIASHKPQSCWTASAQLNVEGKSFTAKVLNAKGSPLALRTESQADHLVRILSPAAYWVEGLIRGARTHPAPTSVTLGALIETTSSDLGLTPARVLSVLATLYEAGWIAHPDAQLQAATREAALAFIQREYGQDYVASEPAGLVGLEPIDIARVPEHDSGDGAALYGLIWRHFVASHMTPAQESITAARIRVGPTRDKKYPIELRATSRTTLFDGWTRVLKDCGQETTDAWLARLTEGVTLHLERVDLRQVTLPAAQRYGESTLALALASAGMPLTEAVTAIAHLHSTGLLASVDGSLTLTDAGQSLTQLLVEHFNDLTGTTCADELAADIERVAAGETSRADILTAFWSRYGHRLSASEGSDLRRKAPNNTSKEVLL